jgi:ABC-type branched-subunit amino acid transport system permease subunit
MTYLEAFGLVGIIALGAAAGWCVGAYIRGIYEDSDPTLTPAWVGPASIVLTTLGTLGGAAAGTFFAFM